MEKPTYNELIKNARKAKGLTQQELADEAGLSLRTVQRIEKGTEEISGYSLKQISKILNIPLEQIIMQNENQDYSANNINSIKALYLSSLTFLIFPLLGFLVPAVLGYMEKNKDEEYTYHWERIIKFQGIWSLIVTFVGPIIILFPSAPSTATNDIQGLLKFVGIIFITIVIAYYIVSLYLVINQFIQFSKQKSKLATDNKGEY